LQLVNIRSTQTRGCRVHVTTIRVSWSSTRRLCRQKQGRKPLYAEGNSGSVAYTNTRTYLPDCSAGCDQCSLCLMHRHSCIHTTDFVTGRHENKFHALTIRTDKIKRNYLLLKSNPFLQIIPPYVFHERFIY
jgi:hypothetical protein